MVGESLAVVGREYDERILGVPAIIQRLQDATDLTVHVLDIAIVAP